MSRLFFAVAAFVVSLACLDLWTIRDAIAQQAPAHDATDVGKQLFTRANCVGCHKWHGYGGAALSLRKTTLTRDQIIKTIACGRPGTGMPFHLRGAYDTQPCYGLTRAQISDTMPPEGAFFLRPSEIEAAADYVIAHVKGKGEPIYDDCIVFFGDSSRVCGIYKSSQPPPPAPNNPAKN